MKPITRRELQTLQKSLDTGAPIPRDETLALYRHHLLVEARLAKLAQLLLESENQRIRTVGLLVAELREAA
jgi:hypothetical protein